MLFFINILGIKWLGVGETDRKLHEPSPTGDQPQTPPLNSSPRRVKLQEVPVRLRQHPDTRIADITCLETCGMRVRGQEKMGLSKRGWDSMVAYLAPFEVLCSCCSAWKLTRATMSLRQLSLYPIMLYQIQSLFASSYVGDITSAEIQVL